MSQRLTPLKQAQGAKYRQITKHLRELILKGELKPGTRLPTARALAKEWDTNDFTVHLALTPLVNEGLIERLRRRGTFVRDPGKSMASVAIFYGGNVWHPDNIFYQCVYQHLLEIYAARRTRTILVMDNRVANDTTTPFAELQKIADQREIQGVIALMLAPPQNMWLKKFAVPVSIFGTHGVHEDRLATYELALSRLAAEGCRKVALISPRAGQEWGTAFRNVARRHGMETDLSWMTWMEYHEGSFDKAGYQLFKEIWQGPNRPDGILGYPDVACRGMLIAALELGIQVPRDLRVIFHRNIGIDYFCPWKIPFLGIDIKEVAHVLVEHLDAQFLHGALPPPIISTRLIEPD